jgi:hypothetical protein
VKKNEIVNLYLSYRYPSPVEFNNLLIPIEKGFIYSKSESSVRIINPFHNKYSIMLFSIDLDGVDYVDNYFKKLGHMLIEIENNTEDGGGYYKIYSVDRDWLFNVAHYFPDQNIMIMYSGAKNDYKNYQRILDLLVGQ